MRITEEDVKRWVREENELLVAEKQAACNHRVSGTYPPDSPDILICDQCDKPLTLESDPEDEEQRLAHPRIPLR